MHKDDDDPKAAHSSLPYAVDEITFPVLGKAAALLLVFTIFSSMLAGSAYWLFVVHEKETAPPVHVIEATPIAPDPNVPILQRDPVAEIHKFRADEYDAERSYSHWKDGDGKTSLRIPIARAMEIVKSKGLPAAVKPEPGTQPLVVKPNSAENMPAGGSAAAAHTSGSNGPGGDSSAGSPTSLGGTTTTGSSGTVAPSNTPGPTNPPAGTRP